MMGRQRNWCSASTAHAIPGWAVHKTYRHNAVLQRILDDQHATTGHGRIADVHILGAGADHDRLGLRRANHGGEDRLRRVLAGNASLAPARAIVDDNSGLAHGGDGDGAQGTMDKGWGKVAIGQGAHVRRKRDDAVPVVATGECECGWLRQGMWVFARASGAKKP